MQQEPQYQVFGYECPYCEFKYEEANSVKKHPDWQICPRCGNSPKKEVTSVR
ncbi:hypothetical protein LCGC14_2143180 [marine sediment metagenome]|uniref:Rubredoxin-like domain-containing protein n=1 Tax=marine sediment metagenome TaxID=412755 RepID=A0A0F9DXQ7_9ZZZZ